MKGISISVLILCGCFVSVAWSEQPTCKLHTPWAEFHRHNMERWNPCEKVLNVHNVGKLQENWENILGGAGFFSPAVVNGVVYAASGYWGFNALNARTGATLWGFKPQAAGPPLRFFVKVGTHAAGVGICLGRRRGFLRRW